MIKDKTQRLQLIMFTLLLLGYHRVTGFTGDFTMFYKNNALYTVDHMNLRLGQFLHHDS